MSKLRLACGLLARHLDLGRDLRLALEIVRAEGGKATPSIKRPHIEPEQLDLWGQGESTLPWRIPGTIPIRYERLRCTLSARDCARFQVRTDAQRTKAN